MGLFQSLFVLLLGDGLGVEAVAESALPLYVGPFRDWLSD